jgi:hypothetical protein
MNQGALGSGDVAAMTVAAVETIAVFELLGSFRPALLPRLAQAAKRLLGARPPPSLQLQILRFFLRHGASVVFDLEPLIALFFGTTLVRHSCVYSLAPRYFLPGVCRPIICTTSCFV